MNVVIYSQTKTRLCSINPLILQILLSYDIQFLESIPRGFDPITAINLAVGGVLSFYFRKNK